MSYWESLNKQDFQRLWVFKTMKKAMNPSRGFEAKEIGKNLFSLKFRSATDMKLVLDREPWHFDKNIFMLKELKGRSSHPQCAS